MSDPVKIVDIEDVLSSIRRLVSESGRGSPPRQVPEAESLSDDDELDATDPDRFVLTHALRVVESDDPDETAAGPDLSPVTEPALARPPSDRSLSRLEATIAELEAAVTMQADEFEPDGSEVKPSEVWSDVSIRMHRRTADPEASDAELVEPESVEDDPFEDELVVPSEPLDEGEPIEDATEESPEGDFQDAAVPDSDDDHQDDLEEDSKDVLGQRRDNGGADGDDDLSSYLDDGMIDEGALRDMVSQIVRQELQGELGERITRNVRKLVRREIYRVVNSQEFE